MFNLRTKRTCESDVIVVDERTRGIKLQRGASHGDIDESSTENEFEIFVFLFFFFHVHFKTNSIKPKFFVFRCFRPRGVLKGLKNKKKIKLNHTQTCIQHGEKLKRIPVIRIQIASCEICVERTRGGDNRTRSTLPSKLTRIRIRHVDTSCWL